MARQPTVAIIAGGLATRLHPITEKIPKSMVAIQGRPFLAYQLDLCRYYGLTEIVICAGFLHEMIEDYFGDGRKFGVHITYSVEQEKLDTGGAVKHALPHLSDPFITLYGDSYLRYNYQTIVDEFKKRNTLGLLPIYKTHGKYDTAVIAASDGLIRVYSKTTSTPDMIYTEYGLNVFRKSVFAGMPQANFPMGDVFQILIAQRQLASLEIPTRFYEIGKFDGLKDFKRFVARGGHRSFLLSQND